MQVTVQGSETRIKLTKSERDKLADAANIAAALNPYCPTAGNTAEALKSMSRRISADGTYRPKEQPKV